MQRGLRYEKLVGQHLADLFGPDRVKYGKWIEYETEEHPKRRWAQPDYIVDLPTGKLVVEAKLTQNLAGDAQLAELYHPLLSFMFPRTPIWLVQTFWNVVYANRPGTRELRAISLLPPSLIHDYHYIPPLGAKVKRATKRAVARKC